MQRKADIAVGNVIGSNLLNILAVLAPVVASSSQGFALHQQLLHLDLPVALGVSVLLLPLFWSGARLDRLEGIALLVLFGLYLWVVAAVALKLPGSQTWINVYLLGILPAAFVLAWIWALLRIAGLGRKTPRPKLTSRRGIGSRRCKSARRLTYFPRFGLRSGIPEACQGARPL